MLDEKFLIWTVQIFFRHEQKQTLIACWLFRWNHHFIRQKKNNRKGMFVGRFCFMTACKHNKEHNKFNTICKIVKNV